MSHSKPFQSYAHDYDMVYREKDYARECDFLEKIFRRFKKTSIRTILDLGCGTGGHAIPLAKRNYRVFGVDLSSQMLGIAQKKAKSVKLNSRLRWKQSNIQKLNLNERFDAVICMFAVLGYQASDRALKAALQTVRRHLKPGSLFICDFWFGPAVLHEKPSDRIKLIEDGRSQLIRIAESKTDLQKHQVTVNYHLFQIRGDKIVREVREKHLVRYLFKPEIEILLKQAGFSLIHFCPFGKLDGKADKRTWNVSAIARAI